MYFQGVKSSGADILIGDKTLPYPYKDKTPDIKDEVHGTPNNDEKSSSSDSHSFTPKYSIVHRGHLDLQNFTNARYTLVQF